MSDAASAIATGRRTLLAWAVLAAAVLLYGSGAAALAELWSDTTGETYTSGFLIAAVAVWLLWRRQPGLAPASLPAPGRWFLLAALGVLGIAWLFALRAGIQVVYLTLLPLLWWFCMWLACGWRAARTAAFPLAFLIFALPVWDYLIPALQWATVHVVRAALRVTGVPSYFSGEYVQIPAGIFQIQGGCSGLHYLIVGLAIAALLGEVRRDGWVRRFEWLLVGGLLALLSNWLRVYSIIAAGHLSHMQSYLVRVSHYSYGWLVFMATLALFFLYVHWRAAPLASSVAGAAPASASGPGVPWLLAVLAVAALPAGLDFLIGARVSAGALFAPGPPALRDGWQANALVDSPWQPVQTGADEIRRRRFTRDQQVIETFDAGYREQRQRKKLGGRANLPGGVDVAVIDEGVVFAGGRLFATQELELAQNGSHARLWRAYQVGERWFADATEAQFWYGARALLSLRSPPSRVWMLRTPCEPDCNAADQRLGRFVEQNGEVLWPESP